MEDKQVSDTWERGDPYEQYMGRWSRLIAPKFLSWLDCPPDLRWLDVGCGTGALCAAILNHCSPHKVTGIEPSPGFLNTARRNLAGQAELYAGRATEIPLESSSADIVVSGLVFNFVPDPIAALAEMIRVANNRGTIAAYVWDYAGKMELIRFFWDAAVELTPAASPLDEGIRFPLCSPESLRTLFASAQLSAVQVTALEIQTRFESFDDYWNPFLGGQGPAPAFVQSLEVEERVRLRELLRKRIPTQASGKISLTARAWAIRASVAKQL